MPIFIKGLKSFFSNFFCFIVFSVTLKTSIFSLPFFEKSKPDEIPWKILHNPFVPSCVPKNLLLSYNLRLIVFTSELSRFHLNSENSYRNEYMKNYKKLEENIFLEIKESLILCHKIVYC